MDTRLRRISRSVKSAIAAVQIPEKRGGESKVQCLKMVIKTTTKNKRKNSKLRIVDSHLVSTDKIKVQTK